jgi:hypothetical protein
VHKGYYEYIRHDGEDFFTAVLLPEEDGEFPIIVWRSPYVQSTREKREEEIVEEYLASFSTALARGYAVVFQHCRGMGKSTMVQWISTPVAIITMSRAQWEASTLMRLDIILDSTNMYLGIYTFLSREALFRMADMAEEVDSE